MHYFELNVVSPFSLASELKGCRPVPALDTVCDTVLLVSSLNESARLPFGFQPQNVALVYVF